MNRISRAVILGLALALGLIQVCSAEENSQQEAIEAAEAASLPGALDGEYVVIQFETSFQNKKSSVETITPMKEKDGTWRVSGYYIK